jgi:protein-S-isoprenylcysteine O-methyltransferase Ste14
MLATPLPLLGVIAAIIILAVTGNLYPAPPAVIAVQLLAVMLSAWARTAFRQGTFRVTAAPAAGSGIIRRGPYRFLRHPMYSAALLFIWAAVVGHPRTLTFALGVAVTVLCVARVFAEERLLRAELAGYDEYASTTKRLIPFVF